MATPSSITATRAVTLATPIALSACIFLFSRTSVPAQHGSDTEARRPEAGLLSSSPNGRSETGAKAQSQNGLFAPEAGATRSTLLSDLEIQPEHLLVPEQCDLRIKIPRSAEAYGGKEITVEEEFEVFLNSPRVNSDEILLQMICVSTDFDSPEKEKMLGVYTFAVSSECLIRMLDARTNAELEQLFAGYSERDEARVLKLPGKGFSRTFSVSAAGEIRLLDDSVPLPK